ncbi:MAG: helix-turn-helix transcriptional regulator [Bauldia sp.]|nr:helix-turn-helix transcriptional regulator [Bauldia sp.]
MTAPAQGWEEVVGLWYAAGLGDVDWSASLGATARLIGGAGGAFFELDRTTGAIGLFEVDRLEAGVGEYAERMNAINPRMRYSLARSAPHVITDYDVLSEAEIGQNEFYDWMERTNGVRYFVGARVADLGPRTLFASIEFDRRRGPADDDRVALFRRLAPHIGNAWRIARLGEAAANTTDILARLVGSRLCGVVGLAADGTVVLTNPAAEATIRKADALVVAGRQVKALRSAADRTLQRLLGRALVEREGGLVAIPRASAGPPLAVRTVPTSVARHDNRLPAVLLLIWDSEQAAIPSEQALHMLGLTDAEVRLAGVLASGRMLASAARLLGMNHNTLRAHLRGIFVKTGVRSQVELVRLLSGLAELDRAPLFGLSPDSPPTVGEESGKSI